MSIEPLLQVRAARAAGTPAAARHLCVVVGELHDGDGQVVVRRLGRRDTPQVVLLARRANRREIVSLLASGLRGAVVSEMRPVTGPVAVPRPRIPEPARTQPLDLTAREIGVIRLVSEGRSNRMIGDELGLARLV